MLTIRKALLLIVAILLLIGCSGPGPAPAPTRPKVMPTLPWVDTLPPDGWFSIRATGRVAPFQSEIIVVYQDGRAVYTDQAEGQEHQSRLDANGVARWKLMFVNQARFMSLKDDYPPGPPLQVEEEDKNLPKSNDAIRYTLMYRDGGVIKKVTANKSGAPPGLVMILDEFWNFADEIKQGPTKE